MDCNEYANQLAEFSWELRNQSIETLERLPEGFINWRLNNTAMSFGHIARHLVHVDKLFLSMLQSEEKTYKWQMGSEEPFYKMDEAEFGEVKDQLRELQKERHAAIQAMDDNALNQKVTGQLGEQSSIWWFIMEKLLEHEIYHRGQLSAYLKIIGGERG